MSRVQRLFYIGIGLISVGAVSGPLLQKLIVSHYNIPPEQTLHWENGNAVWSDTPDQSLGWNGDCAPRPPGDKPSNGAPGQSP